MCIAEKGEKSILPENSRNSNSSEDSRSPKHSLRGATPWPGASLARPGGGCAPWSPSQVGPPPVPSLSPIYSSLIKNIKAEFFSWNLLGSTVVAIPRSRAPEVLFRHPAGGRIHFLRSLHQPCLPSGWAVSCSTLDLGFMVVARWSISLQSWSSMFSPCELPIMIKAPIL